MEKEIGIASCPQCGPIVLNDPEAMHLFIGKGLASPHAKILCNKCKEEFIAQVDWDSAWSFDEMGVKVTGFSRRTAKAIKAEDILDFVDTFDDHLVEFLDIIESENS